MPMGSFDDNLKELDLVVKRGGREHLLTCTMIEFLDKLVIHLSMDGETDISYDIQIPEMNDLKKPIQNYQYEEEEGEGATNNESNTVPSTIIPTVLIGAGDNMKMQVLASQIGHTMSQLSSMNIILNISGKLFGRASLDEYLPGDSLLVQQCLHLVTETYLSKTIR